LLKTWPVAVLFVGVMGSIYTGIATPTESAAIGCVLAFAIAAGYRMLDREVLGRALAGSVRTTAMVLCIFWAAKLMGLYLTYEQITAQLSAMVIGLGLTPFFTLLVLIVFYLVLGMLMDGLAAMIMTLPLTFPIVMSLGFDPVWYGVLLTMLIEAGLLTPPVGINLFILQGLRPDYPFGVLVRGAMPFFFALLAVIALVVAFPGLVTWLPRLVFS
ncbi:MAG: TRAP transporter large permease subunit, partial [Roseovarius sp.]|nr:TRAP transporter large permease subunit [Roseovarius sp.]